MQIKFFDHPKHHRTGGVASRDYAFIACVDKTNRCKDVMQSIMAGGPLDAPEVIPAGGCNSTAWTDWKARALPVVSSIDRP